MFKKIASVLLAGTIMGSILTTHASAEGMSTEMPSESISSIQPRTATFEVMEDWVRMRREPSLSGEVIMLLYRGEFVYQGADHSRIVADGYTWILVSSNRTGWTGWVASEFLSSDDYG